MKKITLIVKVTDLCNFNCPYCYTKSTLRSGSKMDIAIFKKIVFQSSQQYKRINLIFHGGEPLLMSKDWYIEACEYIKYCEKVFNCKIDLGLQSNLSLVDDEFIKIFKKYRIGVGFSYDGTINDTTRKNDELIINNHNKLIKAKENTGCICVITKDNYKNLINELEYFENLNISVKFNIVFNTTTMENDLKDYDIKDFTKKYIEFLNYIIFEKEKTKCDNMLRDYASIITGVSSGLCVYGDCRKRWICIIPNGDYYPCGQEWKQKSKEYNFGNIDKINLKDSFETKEYEKFYNDIEKKRKSCENCIAKSFCNSGCPGEDYSNIGNISKKNKDHCYFTISLYNFFKKINKNKIKNK